MKSKQTGITLIGFLIILAVVAFFGYMAMKLVPSYVEFMGVKKAMNQMRAGMWKSQAIASRTATTPSAMAAMLRHPSPMAAS